MPGDWPPLGPRKLDIGGRGGPEVRGPGPARPSVVTPSVVGVGPDGVVPLTLVGDRAL